VRQTAKDKSFIIVVGSMKVKIFTDTNAEQLEEKVNEFLMQETQIVNIKLATSAAEDSNTEFTVLIMY